MDIEKLKSPDSELSENENLYRTLIERTSEGYWHIDSELRTVDVNQAFCKMIGYSKNELLGKTLFEFVDRRNRPILEAHTTRIPTNGHTSFEIELRKKNGEALTIILNGTVLKSVDGEVKGAVALLTDISTRKKMERELIRAKTLFERMLEAVPDLISIHDKDYNIVFSNWSGVGCVPENRRLLFTKCYQTYRGFDDICPGCKAAKVIATKAPRHSRSQIIDGVHIDISFLPVFDEQGQTKLILEYVKDISELKNSENAFRSSEKRYRDLVENIYEAVFRVNTNGVFSYMSPACEMITGYKPEELIGKPPTFLIHPEDLELVLNSFYNPESRDSNPLEIRILKKSGEQFWIHISGRPVTDESDDTAFHGIFFSINPRKTAEKKKQQLETQLFHSQKMEAVGVLAGGIAHDFNNLLQTIQGYSELIRIDAALGEKSSSYLLGIETAASRAAELTRNLLTFSRKSASRPHILDPNHSIGQVIDILKRTIPKMIQIETRLNESLWSVGADSAQFQSALMNLSLNAVDAMAEGGTLYFETENIVLDNDYCDHNLDASPGRYVLISISDTGRGMKKEIKDRIYEPFFTTKNQGQGAGLGLSMVYGIIKNHGGHITCYSEEERGTTFRIYMPVTASGLIDEENKPRQRIAGGSESILIVDDEEPIRDIASTMLQNFGYNVTHATCGEEALEIYKKDGRNIDLVLLDLGMPGIGGKICLQRLLEMDSSVKVVIASGYSAEGRIKDALTWGAAGFIPKPYRLADLMSKVRDTLDNITP